jgi:hypothetical protein
MAARPRPPLLVPVRPQPPPTLLPFFFLSFHNFFPSFFALCLAPDNLVLGTVSLGLDIIVLRVAPGPILYPSPSNPPKVPHYRTRFRCVVSHPDGEFVEVESGWMKGALETREKGAWPPQI